MTTAASLINRTNRRAGMGERLMNVFAVLLAVFPILTAIFWVTQVIPVDPRNVQDLPVISASNQPRPFDEPLVSVTFDDGWESVYTVAAPILNEYGIRSTLYIMTGEFDDVRYLSIDQAISLKNAGHEIASHTVSHTDLAKVSDKESDKQLNESDIKLQELGLANDLMSFASPYGSTNSSVMQQIRLVYSSNRNVNGDLSNGVNYHDVNVAKYFDRFNIIGFSVRPDTTDYEIQEAIDYAKKHNGWLVLSYHQIDQSDTDDKEAYSTTSEDLERQLRLIKDSGIKTATVRSVIDSYRSR